MSKTLPNNKEMILPNALLRCSYLFRNEETETQGDKQHAQGHQLPRGRGGIGTPAQLVWHPSVCMHNSDRHNFIQATELGESRFPQAEIKSSVFVCFVLRTMVSLKELSLRRIVCHLLQLCVL